MSLNRKYKILRGAAVEVNRAQTHSAIRQPKVQNPANTPPLVQIGKFGGMRVEATGFAL
jgi:hypothetical protein